MSAATDKLRQIKKPQEKGPLWQGPSAEGPNGGITFSMLSRFLSCRERFRLHYVEGLRSSDVFQHRLEYGSMWHVCEEALAKGKRYGSHYDDDEEGVPNRPAWEGHLADYCQQLLAKYPLARQQVQHWYEVCKAQFPVYVKHWSKHKDVVERTPLLQEQVFDVSYTLPSGRTVRLRGKWDAVDLIGDRNSRGIWLQENKTKSEIDEQAIRTQMNWDLQSMLYLVALSEEQKRLDDSTIKSRLSYREGSYRHFHQIRGVRYNVVRRPLSGGKGKITQKKATKGSKCPKCEKTGSPNLFPCVKCGGSGRVGAKSGESSEAFYKRLRKVIEDDADSYFLRFKVEVSPREVQEFRQQCLDPILEQLCDWWEWVTTEDDVWGHKSMKIDNVAHKVPMPNATHWRHPYGCTNWINEGFSTDLDHFLATGDRGGLRRAERLFEELQ